MDVYTVQLSPLDYVIRALIALTPVVAVTLVGRHLGYRGLWLAVPAVLTLAFTLFWSLSLIEFLLGGAPIGLGQALKALSPGFQQGAVSTVTLVLVGLAIFGARSLSASSEATHA